MLRTSALKSACLTFCAGAEGAQLGTWATRWEEDEQKQVESSLPFSWAEAASWGRRRAEKIEALKIAFEVNRNGEKL